MQIRYRKKNASRQSILILAEAPATLHCLRREVRADLLSGYGGRLIRVTEGIVDYVYPKTRAMAKTHGIDVREERSADVRKLSGISDLMADQLAMAVHLKEPDDIHRQMYTNAGKEMTRSPRVEALVFSGGVAESVFARQTVRMCSDSAISAYCWQRRSAVILSWGVSPGIRPGKQYGRQ